MIVVKSLMDDVRSNGNRVASSENTLSHPALFGVRANTIRAACAKAGNLSSLLDQKRRIFSVYAAMSSVGILTPFATAM